MDKYKSDLPTPDKAAEKLASIDTFNINIELDPSMALGHHVDDTGIETDLHMHVSLKGAKQNDGL